MSDGSFRRVRVRLTAWYVGVFAVILLLFGGAVFLAVTREIRHELDESLRAAVKEVERAVEIRDRERITAPGRAVDALEELRIPERALFVFDSAGSPIHPDRPPDWVRSAARAALLGAPVVETRGTGPGRAWRLYAAPFRVGGRRYAAVAVADQVEITEHYPALLAAFAGAALAALVLVAIGGTLLAGKALVPVEAALDQMRRFVADASHELRTPAAILRTRAEVALQRARTVEEYASTVAGMQREAERLGGIVEGLLLLASADAGRLAVRRERLYLDDVLVEAAAAVRTLAAPRGTKVELAGFDEAPILGDPDLVRQLVIIVLENAIKYTPEGGLVEAGVSAPDGVCRLRVHDSGPGIPAEVLPHVYERFYRADPARARTGGAGLGLSIARAIADTHGAGIRIESAPTAGTTVTITFPRA
jgi:signal transduction histidine kinase